MAQEMNIELVLLSLQALFMSLYGVIGIVQSKSYGKRRWVVVLVIYLAVTMLGFFFPDHVKGNIQLILFCLLLLDYLFQSFVFSAKWMRVLLVSTLAFLSYGLLYFQVGRMLLWLVIPLVFGISFILIKRHEDWFKNAQTYFLSAGALLTVLFMLEPVFVSVQQNLKPIPTIPISAIINQYNFLLLGALLLLALGGFFWKEKSRL